MKSISALIIRLLNLVLKISGECLKLIGVLFALVVIYQQIFKRQPVALEVMFLGNASMVGTFISMSLAGTEWEFLAWSAAFFLCRSTPLFLLVVYRLTKLKPMLGFLLAIFGVLLVYRLGYPIDSGRFQVWKDYLSWWWALPKDYHVWGIGLGQTALYLPQLRLIQLIQSGRSIFTPGFYFLSVHNDFIQALVELGIVKCFLASVFTVILFLKATPVQRQRGVIYLSAMLTNFPWHSYPHVFLYWLWIGEILCPRLRVKPKGVSLQRC